MVFNGKNLRFYIGFYGIFDSIFLAFQSLCVSGYFSKHRCQIQQMAFKPERVCALRSVTSAEKYIKLLN